MSGYLHPQVVDVFAEIRSALTLPDLCSEDVTRRGQSEPCEKMAVALRYDPEGGTPYPVCARHARADMVSLDVLLAAVRGSTNV